MQVCKFPDGGFVIHRITHLGSARISAWFAKDGELLDVEKFDKLGRVTHRGLEYAKERCRIIGKIHNPNITGV